MGPAKNFPGKGKASVKFLQEGGQNNYLLLWLIDAKVLQICTIFGQKLKFNEHLIDIQDTWRRGVVWM